MKIAWEVIKEKIKNNIEESLYEGNPSFSEEEVIKGINLYLKLVNQPINVGSLKGVHTQVLPALQQGYIDEKGEMAPLRLLANSMEPFLKKFCIMILNKQTKDIESMTLLELLKLVGFNKALTAQKGDGFPYFEEARLKGFRDKDEYLYQICNAYLVRNQVHLAPNWSEMKIFTYFSDILTTCVYLCLQHQSAIEDLPKFEFQSDYSEKLNSEENKILYDFISFGNTSTEIKIQVVHSYILHYLYNKGTVSIDEIKKECDKYFDSVVGKQFYERRLNRLKEEKQIDFIGATQVALSSDERERLDRVNKEFAEDKDLFLNFYQQLLQEYGIIHYYDELLERLTDFFVKNFDIDIAEIYKRGENISGEKDLFDEFINYINGILPDRSLTNDFFKALLGICVGSDFIVRIGASKVIGKLSNPEHFQNYIKNKARTVYLDTQVVLYLLCVGYLNKPDYDNIYFKTVEELFEFTKQNANIHLKFAKPYLSEVAYQLKLALMLIPFEDFDQSKYSRNVFYQFYEHLKKHDLLEEKDDGFGNFLNNFLLVHEDDAYEDDFDDIVLSNLSGILRKDFNVEVETLPYYEERDRAVVVLDNVLKHIMHTPKPHMVLVNDAHMVCHLSANVHGDEPFFLTWDKTFTEFRKAYKNKYHRETLISWHLFSPSKFLNHMSVMSFRIDPKSIVNEYLYILDSLDFQQTTKSLVDSLNKLTDIKNLPKEQRRKYIELTVELFSPQEFSYEVSLPENEVREAMPKPLESIIEEINKYFNSSATKITMEQYRQTQLNENYFAQTVAIMREELKFNIQYQTSTSNYLSQINALVEKYLQEQTKPNRQ